MLYHWCTSASHSWCSVYGVFWRWWTRLPSSSHKCSIGDRSGDNAGQGGTRIWFWFRKSWQRRTTWHLALSCWMTWSKFRCSRKDRTIGSRILYLYFTAFNVPWTIFSWVRPSRQIPAQTLTLQAQKTVGLIHTLVRKTFPTTAVHTIRSIAKTKRKSRFIIKKDVLPCVKPPTTVCTSPG